MLYLEYERLRLKYWQTQQSFDEVLSEKERLFALTQPQGTDYGKDKINGGRQDSVFDRYLVLKEKQGLDARLDEFKSILLDRKTLLKAKEDDLRDSREPIDKVYCCRYLDRMKVYKISMLLHYSEPQINRFLNEIRINLKIMRDFDRK